MTANPGPIARVYRSGEVLFKEGDASTSMYLIKRGTIEVRKAKGSGHILIGRAYTNEVIGELSFFDRQPRSATAVAEGEVEVMELPFANLDKQYKQLPDYFRAILASVAERLRKANETVRKLQTQVRKDEESGGGESSSSS